MRTTRNLTAFVAASCVSWAVLAQAPAPDKTADKAVDPATAALSIADLEKLFTKSGMSDGEVAESVGATMPLSPDQIRTFRRYVDEIRRAQAEPPKRLGKPEVSSAIVSLAPGVAPHTLRLQENLSTTLVFQDATGAPWPVKQVNAGGGEEAWAVTNTEGSNIVIISPKAAYAHANLVVLLADAPAPVILTLDAGYHDSVHYRFDAIVQGRGPLAQTLSLDLGRGPAMTAEMISFQDGVPPDGAESLRTAGSDQVQAWRWNGRLFLRTPFELQTPEPHRAAASPDGMHVYELDETPMVYLTHQGRSVRVSIAI